MSLDPDERLEALRREVLAERPTANPPDPVASMPAPGPGTPMPTLADAPVKPGPSGMPEPPPSEPSVATPAPAAPSGPQPAPPARSGTPSPADDPSPGTRLLSGIGDLDVHALLSDRGLSSWLGIGLLVVGGYLVLSLVVPGISVIGSLALLLAGIALLYLHLVRGAPPWALYAGAALAGMGSMRVLGALLPGDWHGTTAIGVGIAFLAIGYLRHTQAGGYGWQGVVGLVAIVVGLAQMVLGWLPGSPGLLDLLSPAVLLILGALLVLGTRGGGHRPPPKAM